MNVTEIFSTVEQRSNEQQAVVILAALENLSRKLASMRLPDPHEWSKTDREVRQQYLYQLNKQYENTRIMMHHTYKWLRDGLDYVGNELSVMKQRRRQIKDRYEKLVDDACALRRLRDKVLLELDPEEAHKRMSKSRRKFRLAPLAISDRYMFP